MKKMSFEEAKHLVIKYKDEPEVQSIRNRITNMKNDNKWYLILILAPKLRYTISKSKECQDIVFPIRVIQEFNNYEEARAEANCLNNQMDRI